MSPDVCRAAFVRAAATADLAIVEGQYDRAVTSQSGGSLDMLCQWLGLPRLAIVDVSILENCHFPARPDADALLLDQPDGERAFCRWQTVLESLWGVPVLGGLENCPALRQATVGTAPGQKPPLELCHELGERFRRFSNIGRLLELATRPSTVQLWQAPQPTPTPLPSSKVRVAVAYDEAFNCYFPDTLDLLELHGATVRVFSPLRDECLPAGTDVVYFGCGHPERHTAALAENQCMLMAIKEHVCAGRRVYAEGGGLAYLCQHIQLPDGSLAPMVGALRAVARRNPVRSPATPVEITLAQPSWLGPAGTQVRGYRNNNWLLSSTGSMVHFAAEPELAMDLIGRHQVIGSRVHLNFAAQPALLGGFFQPCPQALAWSGTR